MQKKTTAVLTLAIHVIAWLLVAACVSAIDHSESELKSVFVFNFTQFVDWPPSAFGSPSADFEICILGNDPFGATLDATVHNEKVSGHPIVVRRISGAEEVADCQLAYIAPERITSVRRVLTTSGRPILTISDNPEFVDDGGIIAMHVVDRRLQVRINLKAARTANLTISSKLLRLSDVIGEP